MVQYSNFNVVEYFKALELVQQNISMLMKHGSAMKILFKDSFGNWLYFVHQDKDIKPIMLNHNIWNVLSFIISQTDDIYIARDIFYQLDLAEYDHYLDELFHELKNITTWDSKLNSKNAFMYLLLTITT